MTSTFVNSFILFFVTIDTIGNLPFFLSLTEGAKIKKRNQIALKSIIIAFFIMITFAYLGRYLLDAIHVTLDSLKIAGGVILMFLAIDIGNTNVTCGIHDKKWIQIIKIPSNLNFWNSFSIIPMPD